LRFLSSSHSPTTLKQAWAMIREHIDLHDLDLTASPAVTTTTLDVKARASKSGDLDSDIHHAFLTLFKRSKGTYASGEVLFHHQHNQCGVSYADFHTSMPHSIMYFHPESPDSHNQSNLRPAQIRTIFSHKRRGDEGQLIHEVFFAVHEYKVSDKNPFVSFPDFRAAIFHREPDDLVQVIRATQVHCHANQRPWDEKTVVMRPIDRVSFIHSVVSTIVDTYILAELLELVVSITLCPWLLQALQSLTGKFSLANFHALQRTLSKLLICGQVYRLSGSYWNQYQC
jgi:hypothetical protein